MLIMTEDLALYIVFTWCFNWYHPFVLRYNIVPVPSFPVPHYVITKLSFYLTYASETVLISCQTSVITSFTKFNSWHQMLKYVVVSIIIIIIIIIIITSMCCTEAM
jgi:hypothetical protein